MKVNITTDNKNKQYEVTNMKEYDIETSLDIPADYFKLVFSNPVDQTGVGIHSNKFNYDDDFQIVDGGEVILQGISDDVDEGWDSQNGSYIEITGRDKALLLLDNDAEPQTYYNLSLSALINKLAGPYGFKSKVVGDSTIEKIVVDVGMSEWDVLFEEAKKLGLWLWCEADGTLVANKLNAGSPIWTFSNHMKEDRKVIKMTSFIKKKRGADIKNEVWVRGHHEKTFTHKYKSGDGRRRRMIMEDPDAKSIGDAAKTAKNKIDESKRGSFELELECSGKYNIKVNQVARVKEKITKIDGEFLVIGVKSIKSSSAGNVKRVRLRPKGEGL